MNEIKHAKTKREVLMIEAIDEIDVLIRHIGEAESKFMPIVDALENKLVTSISLVDKHVEEKQAEFAVVADREKKLFEEKLNASVAKTVSKMVKEMQRAEGLSVKWQLLLAMVIGLTASAVSIYGSYLMFGGEQDKQAAIGRAVMSVWNDLDDKSKKMIEEGY